MKSLLLIPVLFLSLMISACTLQSAVPQEQQIAQASTNTATATDDPEPEETIPPSTPLPTLTPSNTLRPPPTFEPPTLTPEPSNTPSITPTSTIEISSSLPELQGLWTPTGQPSEECVPNEDWLLRYEVQPGDAVASIAQKYGTFTNVLAEANCLEDPSLIVVGQFLRVPGDLHPATPEFDCTWELLTPLNGTITVPGEGTITFNWRGPETPRSLVRIYRGAEGTGDHILEYMVEYRRNYTMDLSDLPEGGTFSWRVFPLSWEFVQIGCPESYSSQFTKAPAPTAVPTPEVPGGNGDATP